MIFPTSIQRCVIYLFTWLYGVKLSLQSESPQSCPFRKYAPCLAIADQSFPEHIICRCDCLVHKNVQYHREPLRAILRPYRVWLSTSITIFAHYYQDYVPKPTEGKTACHGLLEESPSLLLHESCALFLCFIQCNTYQYPHSAAPIDLFEKNKNTPFISATQDSHDLRTWPPSEYFPCTI